MIVISDTSPICYLLLIEQIELLPQLYTEILIPTIVQQELSHPRSPLIVQNWINNPPKWLVVRGVNVVDNSNLDGLDAGEQAAIILAEEQKADLLIVDDALGRKIAHSRGLKVTGLLGVLNEAAQQNLIDLPTVIDRLQQTTFRASSQLIQLLLTANSQPIPPEG
jgi:predicted nucleic acid-binding protein